CDPQSLPIAVYFGVGVMSRIDERLRSLGQAAELRRLVSKGAADPETSVDPDPDTQNSYSYQGVRSRRHWVRRNDGRLFSGNLATNGAIAIGARVRFANRQIDAMPFQPIPPQAEPKAATPKFLGEVLVVFLVPDP
ncbi:MAG: hypothetical protein AAGF75_08015, partial [Cyanobacteria bacterium P01_H01_bin.130]